MINQIRRSVAFQNDLKRYDVLIEKLPEGQEKNEVRQLVATLIAEVKKMDDLHVELIYNKQMPSLGTERREKIISTRKQLETKLKELKSSIE